MVQGLLTENRNMRPSIQSENFLAPDITIFSVHIFLSIGIHDSSRLLLTKIPTNRRMPFADLRSAGVNKDTF